MSPISRSLMRPATCRSTTPSAAREKAAASEIAISLDAVALRSAPPSPSVLLSPSSTRPSRRTPSACAMLRIALPAAIAPDRAPGAPWIWVPAFRLSAASRVAISGRKEARSSRLGRGIERLLQRSGLIDEAAAGHDSVGAEGLRCFGRARARGSRAGGSGRRRSRAFRASLRSGQQSLYPRPFVALNSKHKLPVPLPRHAAARPDGAGRLRVAAKGMCTKTAWHGVGCRRAQSRER